MEAGHADGGAVACLAGRSERAVAQAVEQGGEVLRRDFRPSGRAVLLEKMGGLREVALVGLRRVAREALLQFDVAEVTVDVVGKPRRGGWHRLLLSPGLVSAAGLHSTAWRVSSGAAGVAPGAADWSRGCDR